MATYNERITAGTMTHFSQTGSETPITGASSTVSAKCRSRGSHYGEGYTQAIEWTPNLNASAYKSSKKFKSAVSFIYLRSKTLTSACSGDIQYPEYFPGDARREAIWSNNAWWDDQIHYLSRFLSSENNRISLLSPGYVQGSALNIPKLGSTQNLYDSTFYVTVEASVTIDGPTGANPPYTDVVWEDIVPIVSGMAPSNGAYINDTLPATFLWTLSDLKAYDGTDLTGSSVFKWRYNGTTHTVSANATSVTIPAGTFPSSGVVEWCVVHTTTDGLSNAENWQTITTVEATPRAPINLSPSNEVVNGDAAITFSWRHNISTGSAQSRADLEKSDNGSTWTTLATVIGAAQSVNVPAGSFTAGEKMWRVRTYNTDNTPGPYASASIIVKATPAPPGIESITGVPLATITWSVGDQVGFRVVFTDAEGNTYDSGERYGAVNTFTSPMLLSEGEASVTVYVGNSSGLWSSTTVQFSVANNASGSITLEGSFEHGKVALSWSHNTTSSAFYVLKNGKPVAKVYGVSYEDKTANGSTVYEVIGMKADSTYVRSNAITLDVRIMGTQVFDYEHDGELIDLYIRRNSIFELTKARTANTSYYHFCGNTFPTAYTELHQNETISFTITKENPNVEAIFGLVGVLCCIKDKTGAVAFGILDSVSENTDRYSDLTLTFTRTEDEEGVVYET